MDWSVSNLEEQPFWPDQDWWCGFETPSPEQFASENEHTNEQELVNEDSLGSWTSLESSSDTILSQTDLQKPEQEQEEEDEESSTSEYERDLKIKKKKPIPRSKHLSNSRQTKIKKRERFLRWQERDIEQRMRETALRLRREKRRAERVLLLQEAAAAAAATGLVVKKARRRPRKAIIQDLFLENSLPEQYLRPTFGEIERAQTAPPQIDSHPADFVMPLQINTSLSVSCRLSSTINS